MSAPALLAARLAVAVLSPLPPPAFSHSPLAPLQVAPSHGAGDAGTFGGPALRAPLSRWWERIGQDGSGHRRVRPTPSGVLLPHRQVGWLGFRRGLAQLFSPPCQVLLLAVRAVPRMPHGWLSAGFMSWFPVAVPLP